MTPNPRRVRVKFHNRIPRFTWRVGGGAFPLHTDTTDREDTKTGGEFDEEIQVWNGNVLFGRWPQVDGSWREIDNVAQMAYSQWKLLSLTDRGTQAPNLAAGGERIVMALSRFSQEGVPIDLWWSRFTDDFPQWPSRDYPPWETVDGEYRGAYRLSQQRPTRRPERPSDRPWAPDGKNLRMTWAFRLADGREVENTVDTRWANFESQDSAMVLSVPIGQGSASTETPETPDARNWEAYPGDWEDFIRPAYTYADVPAISPITMVTITQSGVRTREHWARRLTLSDTTVPLQGQRGAINRRSATIAIREDTHVLPGWYAEFDDRLWLITNINRPPGDYVEITIT